MPKGVVSGRELATLSFANVLVLFGLWLLVTGTGLVKPLFLPGPRAIATDVVIMGILVIGAIAILFEFGMRCLERTLVPWKGKA